MTVRSEGRATLGSDPSAVAELKAGGAALGLASPFSIALELLFRFFPFSFEHQSDKSRGVGGLAPDFAPGNLTCSRCSRYDEEGNCVEISCEQFDPPAIRARSTSYVFELKFRLRHLKTWVQAHQGYSR